MAGVKPTEAELRLRLADCPKKGTRWQHRLKGGNIYKVRDAVLREEDLMPLVVYSIWQGVRWARPLGEFLETFKEIK